MITYENKGAFFCEHECESMNSNDKMMLHLGNSAYFFVDSEAR